MGTHLAATTTTPEPKPVAAAEIAAATKPTRTSRSDSRPFLSLDGAHDPAVRQLH
jgi:hypothetical protein